MPSSSKLCTTSVIGTIVSRRVLYLAVLLHDIAKGRGGDHSMLGEEVARKLGPRLGLTAEETDQVAWLVRWHLLMSNTAFKRDIDDPQTIQDFGGSFVGMLIRDQVIPGEPPALVTCRRMPRRSPGN